jgi:predicted PurR-regulated permease PerM
LARTVSSVTVPGPCGGGATWHAGQVTDQPPSQGRLARLWAYADVRHVPLRTILVTVAVVAVTYLAGQVIYRLRTLALVILVAGFVALLLNPLVVLLQRRIPRRGLAVTIVTLAAFVVIALLAYQFGNPLVNGITDLASRLPGYVTSAEHGTGWIGHLSAKYHIQSWVQKNAPKLVTYAESLSKPVLTLGKGAISLLIELFTIFVLVLLLLLEAPKMRTWLLGQMRPERAATVTRIGSEVSRSVTGYMLGNFLTSLIAGTVVFVTLLIVGVPFPLLWGLWVALVDFLPMIGGALAGIPTVLFAFFSRGFTAGVVTLVVFLVYTQVENHILNPVIMSRTVRINPLLVLLAVLIGAELGDLVGGLFGAFVAALLAIPLAGALQVLAREAWQATAPKKPPAATVAVPPGSQSAAGPHGEPFRIVPDAREHDN